MDNANGVFSGWRNVKLNSRGVRDAKIVALRLKDKKIDLFFHSDLERSKQTLREVLKFHKNGRVICDKRLRERCYGKLQGKTHLQIAQKIGVENYDLWHRGYSNKPPKGESLEDVEKRVVSFIKDLLIIMKKEKINVAISAHGNSMRPFRRYFEKLSRDQMCNLYNDYEAVYTYELNL